MSRSVKLPWRAFKAFHQQFCLDVLDSALLEKKNVQMFGSKSVASIANMKTLEESGIVSFHRDAAGVLIGVNRTVNAATYGYEDYLSQFDNLITVYPANSSANGAAWIACKGHCDYCGTALTLFGRDALGRKPQPLIGSAWACKTCQTIKKDHSVESFRELMVMREFEKETGVRFSREQLDYLGDIGISQTKVGLNPYLFNFEKHQQT